MINCIHMKLLNIVTHPGLTSMDVQLNHNLKLRNREISDTTNPPPPLTPTPPHPPRFTELANVFEPRASFTNRDKLNQGPN